MGSIHHNTFALPQQTPSRNLWLDINVLCRLNKNVSKSNALLSKPLFSFSNARFRFRQMILDCFSRLSQSLCNPFLGGPKPGYMKDLEVEIHLNRRPIWGHVCRWLLLKIIMCHRHDPIWSGSFNIAGLKSRWILQISQTYLRFLKQLIWWGNGRYL